MRGSLLTACEDRVKRSLHDLVRFPGAGSGIICAMAATSASVRPAAAPLTLGQMLETPAPAREIEAYLDGLASEARLAEVLGITGRGVKRLYEAVEGGTPPTLEDLVPAGTEGVLIYEGRNSLAAFSRFQKRFVRKGGLVLGYNHQSMSFVTGPGYFVVHPPSGSGEHGHELDFDYTTAPPAEPAAPEGWPAYTPNEQGLSRFVYGHMHDYVRRVAHGVVVGKAYRHGKEQDAYFSLTLPR
jgi:hypothetical protein